MTNDKYDIKHCNRGLGIVRVLVKLYIEIKMKPLLSKLGNTAHWNNMLKQECIFFILVLIYPQLPRVLKYYSNFASYPPSPK